MSYAKKSVFGNQTVVCIISNYLSAWLILIIGLQTNRLLDFEESSLAILGQRRSFAIIGSQQVVEKGRHHVVKHPCALRTTILPRLSSIGFGVFSANRVIDGIRIQVSDLPVHRKVIRLAY